MSHPHPSIPADRIRIIGQGLTGTLLALLLDAKGIPFIVQDVALPGASTPVAPGIVNPLAGRKFLPPGNIETLLEDVQDCLQLAEKQLGTKIWNACPILRVFADPSQIDRYERAIADGRSLPFIAERHPENLLQDINDTFGSFTTTRGGWANLPLLQTAAREWLKASNRLIEEKWHPEEPSEGEFICFCEGWQVSNSPFWDFIPHNPAKGEMLIVEFKEPLARHQIYNQSCWIQPIEDSLWRVGATYSWSAFDSTPSTEGIVDLRERLQLLTNLPFKVLDQVAGVRPIVEDYRPVIGEHPHQKGWFILNAMGSKGVLQAPHAAKALIDLITQLKPPPAEWRLERFL
jgi:glycine/D-amino acid oxidase-like deaminating enzyme